MVSFSRRRVQDRIRIYHHHPSFQLVLPDVGIGTQVKNSPLSTYNLANYPNIVEIRLHRVYSFPLPGKLRMHPKINQPLPKQHTRMKYNIRFDLTWARSSSIHEFLSFGKMYLEIGFRLFQPLCQRSSSFKGFLKTTPWPSSTRLEAIREGRVLTSNKEEGEE